MKSTLRKLSADELRRITDPATIAGVGASEDERSFFIGQERAAAALRFGLKVRGSGFHVFAAGMSGTGKETLVRRYCNELAQELPAPPDWCYVYNFRDPDRPRAIRFESGHGTGFVKAMSSLIHDVRRELKRAFRAESYQRIRESILQEVEDVQERELREVDELAKASGFKVERQSDSFVTVPLHENGEPLSTEAYSNMDDAQREDMARRERELTVRLKTAISRIQDAEEAVRGRIESLEREVAEHAITPLFEHVVVRYQGQAEVLDQLEQVKEDILENLEVLLTEPDPEEPGQGAGWDVPERYKVNYLAAPSKDLRHAPVVFEPHPTLYNLLGRVSRPASRMEYRPAGFMDIKCGSLHRANGGFLILHALDVIKEPFAWEGLKRALRSKTVSPARPREEQGMETESLRPTPIELDVVVILLGEVELYHELFSNDPDFGKIFTVKAHFSDDLVRNEESEREYARFIHDRCREKGLLPFTDEAIARVVDEGSVYAGSQDRLTACFKTIADLLQEADYHAREAGRAEVTREDVEAALAAKKNRVDLYEEQLQQMVERGEILLETKGSRVGQVNALAVFDMGDHVFARPSRITCTVGLGQGGLVDIEREAELGGPIHTKGVLLLRGFLISRFAKREPLTLSASLAFEQSYGLVDGDSASFAELAALLSAISEVPLRQDIAVTGSINQMGLLQAIGGVTEKVTGFYRVCKAQGLTGEQGVIVPESSTHQLTLPVEVVQAVKEGRFSVWAASDVASALELLTGIPTGEPDAEAEGDKPGYQNGGFPPGTLYATVASKLRAFNAALGR